VTDERKEFVSSKSAREGSERTREVVMDAGVEHSPCGDTRTGDNEVEWLTREEWNACYFLGQEAFFRDHVKCGLCDRVSIGMERLINTGYEFEMLRAGSSGRLKAITTERPPGEHHLSCEEVASGAFDDIGRARDALRWLQDRTPGVSTKWLEDILDLYDQAHDAQVP
jgi:hypothetical protein